MYNDHQLSIFSVLHPHTHDQPENPVCMYVCMYVKSLCILYIAPVYVCMYVCVCMCICIYICTYMYVCITPYDVCMYVWDMCVYDVYLMIVIYVLWAHIFWAVLVKYSITMSINNTTLCYCYRFLLLLSYIYTANARQVFGPKSDTKGVWVWIGS